MIKDLNNHFAGECTEVGMYLGNEPSELTVKAILKLQKLTKDTLGKKLNTLQNSQNYWANVVTGYYKDKP